MSTPSLLLVPARLKAGTLFSQIPTNGSGDFTVVQAVGNATRYNSSGFVESAKTNLILRSEEFDNAYWSKPLGVVTQNQTIAPDGLTTADKYVVNNGQATNSPITRNVTSTLAINTTYTLSLFVKKADYDTASIRLSTTETAITANFFNLASGTATNNQIQDYGNGWYRVWVTLTTAATVTNGSVQLIRDAQVRNGVAGIFIWGVQLEIGSSPSEYIQTIASQRTRFSGVTVDGTVTANIPRLDYYTSNGTPGCPGLLVEASGSNTLSGSVSLDTGWTITADTTVTSGIVSPSESTNATLFQATNTASRVRQAATLTSGSTYTFSCFGKFGALSSGFSLNVFDENAASYGSGVCQAFNLNEGTLGASGTTGAGFTLQSVGMENYGSGWYRCRMTVLMGYTPTTPRVGFRVGTQISNGRPLSVASGTVNAWGAQLETGSVATSYIPTTTAAVTRAADHISVSGAVSGSIGQTEGTIYVEVDVRNTSSGKRLFLLSDGTTQNEIRVTSSAINAGDLQFAVRLAGTLILNAFSPTNVYSNGIFKIAAIYKSTDYALYVNGLQVLTGNAAGNIPACNRVDIGSQLGTSNFFNDRIRAAALYTTRLTNADLMLLTMPGNNTYLPQAIWDNYLSRTGNSEVPDCLYTRHADLLDV